MPFTVNYVTGSITQFGRPGVIKRNGKPMPLSPRQFAAAALLIEHMGQYVSVETLCTRLQCDPIQLQRIMTHASSANGRQTAAACRL